MTATDLALGVGLVALVLTLVAVVSDETPAWAEALARSPVVRPLYGAANRLRGFRPFHGVLERFGLSSQALAASVTRWRSTSLAGGGSRSTAEVLAPTGGPRLQTFAVYEGGVLKPDGPLNLPEGSRVRMTIEIHPGGQGAAAQAAWPVAGPMGTAARRNPVLDVGAWVSRAGSAKRWLILALLADWGLFAFALSVYALTRLWGLEQFPIFFFADEAVHTLLAEDLLARGFRDNRGNFLPLYFEAAGQRWTPLLSVYVHAVPLALFGKSIFITRATSAVVSMLGAAAVGLILKQVFHVRMWWTGVLFMAIAPAWFLHSRTAFETVMMASFLAVFLLFYLLYRTRSPRFIFPALVFAAAAFYTYSNGQVIMGALGVLLLASDFKYHARQWRTLLVASVLGFLLAWPLIAFRLGHPVAMETHLRVLDSYWFQPLSLDQKLQRFLQIYWNGLSPSYWFFSNTQDLARHRFDDAGHLPVWMLPLTLAGIGLCLWRVRSSAHRAVLLTLLATPAAASLVGVGITRVLALVVPASVLAGLGVEMLLSRLRHPLYSRAAAPTVFVALSLGSLLMLRQALVEGPFWFRDYGLYGMQWGARQLFEEAIPQVIAREPNTLVLVSPTWANGTDTFLRFFFSRQQQPRVTMLNVDHYLNDKRDLTPNLLLVMTAEEYRRAQSSGKFKIIQVERTIPYPDGTPGFYLARLAYAENVDAVFAAEREARRRPMEAQVELQGQPVRALHSRFGAGQLRDIFDGDRFTLVRGLEANPLVVELNFPQPRTVSRLVGDFGTMDFSLTVQLFQSEASEPVVYSSDFRGLPSDPHVELDLGAIPHTVSRVRIEIRDLRAGETAGIHIRELAFQ